MGYKTILVHIDQSRACKQRVRIAAALAREQNAHLIGAAPTGVSRYVYQSRIGGAVPNFAELNTYIEGLREVSRKELADFEECARGTLVPTYESILIEDEASAGIALRGHYCDLVITGQFDPDEPNLGTAPDFTEYVAASSGRPVLVLPHSRTIASVGRRVLVAWDAGPQATRAVTGALPLLKNADMVDIAVFNADDNLESHGEQPGADIALYISRHGIKVNVLESRFDDDVGNALLSLAADRHSDLLVMGCYGHSRFREMLAGGVTRKILASMTLPTLMAH